MVSQDCAWKILLCMWKYSSKSKDSNISFHCFPFNDKRRLEWLEAFQRSKAPLESLLEVFSRWRCKKKPKSDLRKEIIVSNQKGPRAKRAKVREENKQLDFIEGHSLSSKSRSATPAAMDTDDIQPVLTASIGKQLF